MSGKYKVWTCKIVVKGDAELPDGFDSPPRMAAENAIANAGFNVVMNASEWGGSLDKYDLIHLEEVERQGRQDVYYAGAMDAPDDVQH